MLKEQDAIDAICNSLLGFIIKTTPDLSLSDLDIFLKEIIPDIKEQIKKGNKTIFYSDNRPAGELWVPFRKMKAFKNDPGKADSTSSLTFPLKMYYTVDLKKGRVILNQLGLEKKLPITNEYKINMMESYEKRFNAAQSTVSEQELKELEQKYNKLLEQVEKRILPTDNKDETTAKLKTILSKLNLQEVEGITVDGIKDGETEFYARMITAINKKKQKEIVDNFNAELEKAKTVEEFCAIDKKYKHSQIEIDEFLVDDCKIYSKLKKELANSHENIL